MTKKESETESDKEREKGEERKERGEKRERGATESNVKVNTLSTTCPTVRDGLLNIGLNTRALEHTLHSGKGARAFNT